MPYFRAENLYRRWYITEALVSNILSGLTNGSLWKEIQGLEEERLEYSLTSLPPISVPAQFWKDLLQFQPLCLRIGKDLCYWYCLAALRSLLVPSTLNTPGYTAFYYIISKQTLLSMPSVSCWEPEGSTADKFQIWFLDKRKSNLVPLINRSWQPTFKNTNKSMLKSRGFSSQRGMNNSEVIIHSWISKFSAA